MDHSRNSIYVKPMCPMSYVVQKAEETASPVS